MVSKPSAAAFTLIEVLVGLGVLGGAAAAAIAALLQMNYNANLSRLRTGAGTAVQNQIDYLLSVQPYNPQKNQVPAALEVGTQLKGSASNPTVPIYTDPVTGQVVVWGWMVTEVTDTNQTCNSVNLNLRRANVTAFYVFRNRTYSIEMSTLRSSDI